MVDEVFAATVLAAAIAVDPGDVDGDRWEAMGRALSRDPMASLALRSALDAVRSACAHAGIETVEVQQ